MDSNSPTSKIDTSEIDNVKDLQYGFGSCESCNLHRYRVTSIRGTGSVDADIVFVLDRLDMEHLPGGNLEGPQLQALATLLEPYNLRPGQFWVTPITMCPTCPTHDEPGSFPREIAPPAKRDAWVACRDRLHREIHLVNPEIIIACGTNALKALLKKTAPKHAENMGRLIEVEIQGNILYPVPTLVTYSLLALVRTPIEFDVESTWKKAAEHLHNALGLISTIKEIKEKGKAHEQGTEES